MTIGTDVEEKPATSASQQSLAKGWRGHLRALFDREYLRTSRSSLRGVPGLLAIIAVSLTFFGLVMVLSASSVEEISSQSDPFSQVLRQLVFALLGFAVMGALAFIPVTVYRNKWVMTGLLGLAFLMQLLVIAVGTTVNGNRNWIQFAGISIQPSELSKLIMALWMAWILTQQGNISKYRKALFPLLFGFIPLIFMILLGHDVGTIMVYAIMLLIVLWNAGIKWQGFAWSLGIVALLGVLAVLSSENRRARVLGVLGHCEGSTCDQSQSGLAALATGGFWGVGLGSSRQKYNYLPEAHNDYIFAVIGEELGLLGTLLVLFLYLGIVYCVVRIMLRTADRFIALASGAILAWILGQALINMAMVTGLMPVIGVPLPFISYGGSSLVSSLAAMGVLIGFARQTPLLPLIETNSKSFYAGSSNAKEARRRQRLGAVVEAENARLRAAGDSAGFDIAKVLSWPIFTSLLGDRRRAGTSRLGRSVSKPQATSYTPPKKENRTAPAPHPEQKAATRQESLETAPERTFEEKSQQDGKVDLGGRKEKQSQELPIAPKPKPQGDLPPGLKPIKQIRQQRENRQD